MQCPKCHSNIENGSKFCNHCGALMNVGTQCPHCHNEVPAGSKFCNHCGECLATITTCPLCGFENPAGSRFCTECGSHLFLPAKKSAYKSENVTQKQPVTETVKEVLPQETFNVFGVRFTMVRVEGGTFTMGATSEQQSPYDDEKPTHRVTLSSYMIGQTEVTQELWQEVMGNNPSQFKGTTNPVERVSWNDCQDFIHKLKTLTGRNFRLPTEAEWEFAARGGNKSKGYQYSGCNNLNDVAWYTDNSGEKTHPVATKAPNELGIYDMSGNVWEWCSDFYGPYSSASQTNPQGCHNGQYHVLRGGGYTNSSYMCRLTRRFYLAVSSIAISGFRLALSE